MIYNQDTAKICYFSEKTIVDSIQFEYCNREYHRDTALKITNKKMVD